MRLISMDVDRFGTSQRCHLGPLSPGLNAIHGAAGTGKTTLLRWLRVIAEENQGQYYSPTENGSLHSASPLAGIAEIVNRGNHYRVTTDRNGRIRFDLARDAFGKYQRDYEQRWDGRLDAQLSDSNLSPLQRAAFLGMAAANDQYDTEAALEQLAQRLGLDSEQAPQASGREQLLNRQRDLEQHLASLKDVVHSRDNLLARQQQLESELQACRGNGRVLRYEGQNVEHMRLDERQAILEADLQNTLREIEICDQELASKQRELKLLETDSTAVTIGESYRVQLQKLDDRLNRWRQTLRDLKAHREAVEHNATDVRLDKQIGDQLSATKEPDPRAAMRSLEAQIQSTRRQLDMLVDRYTTVPGYDYRSASAAVSGTGFRTNEVPASHGVYRDVAGQTYVGHPTYLPESSVLPETLRSMQKDLHEVCQQLARHEASTASETLRQQSSQLKRCEAELLEAVEKLIEERASLLRRIANEHHISIEQLTLAFGQWCQCHDHPHLQDWLLSEESNCPTQKSGADPGVRQALLDEIDGLKKKRRDAAVYADECRRQMRDADMHRRGVVAKKAEPLMSRPELDIQRELQEVVSELSLLAERERSSAELAEIRNELRRTTDFPRVTSRFRETVNRHIAALMGPKQYEPVADYAPQGARRYDLVDGLKTVVSEPMATRRAVPKEVVRLAMRLSIAEMMAARGEPVALVVDNALETIPDDIQPYCVQHLSSVAHENQQVILLTACARVADFVQSAGGWITSLQGRPAMDPNRDLMALANDHEAEKWHQPVVSPSYPRGSSGEYYLTESSLVEDLPAIDPDVAARCRSQGVDRIGDLLDVDPLWLADQLRIDGVTRSTVETWQTVANLLCTVRNLRPFDARVIVGAGVRSPRELASMHPSQLLDRVERFLTTDNGRRILRSGNSYELSRITSWIASAKGRHYEGDERYEYESSSTRNRRSRYDRDYDRDYARGQRRDYDAERYSHSRRERRSYPVISRNGSRHGHDWNREDRDYARAERSQERERNSSESRRSESTRRQDHKSSATRSRNTRGVVESSDTQKFYLELSSPVVDAPSIGPRMAERLEEFDIQTVDQLLAADAETLAEQLDHRRVDVETILAWQQQARLVCRIPNLRGHDAQLLVACEFTSPELLASMDAEEVLTAVTKVAQSKEGQRILRGGKEPDLDEVVDWISWAGESRKLTAA